MVKILYYIPVSDFGKSRSAAERAARFLKDYFGIPYKAEYYTSTFERATNPTVMCISTDGNGKLCWYSYPMERTVEYINMSTQYNKKIRLYRYTNSIQIGEI